ncbi:uncharacterized protein LOC126095318 isoform X1 [Schistocerca cancellata]|uniref:uncharacterized protein LOC126095318 isoform X1 n=1 Tax=Schistocerca cancellata TaxID=274614 RepID=UPI0021179EF7|nr:uncharacterized protein LOC126095318 isoform X1 [Schistocerca cancellata]
MSSRMVRRNIESLSKEISSVEQKLQDVLKSKSKKPGLGRNETASRDIELFITGPSGKKLPTAIVKPDTLFRARKASGKCVDVFENNDGTVKVTIERNSSSRENRRRSRSTPEINLASADDERATKSSENMKKVADRRSTTGVMPRKVKATPRSLHQSWGDVLDGKHRSANATQQPRKTQQGNLIKKQPEKCDNSDVRPSSAALAVQRKDSNNAVKEENSAVASRTSISKNNASESIPACKPQHDTSSLSPSSSSCYRSSVASGSREFQSAIPHSQAVENEPFALFNPVTTLNFLVKELRGIVRKNSTPTCISRVLCDIERTVARIPPEVCEKDVTHGHGDARVRHVVQAPPPELLEELRRNVEHMEHRSRQLHSTCEALRKDRDQLRQTLTTRQSEMDAILHILKEKEATIEKLQRDFASVSAKTEEYCKTITEMSATVITLKESKEDLLKKQEALESRLKETVKELEKQTAELQLKNLEREKMAAQLGSRERELEVCKLQLMEMKTLVRDQLTALREAVRGGLPPSQIPPPSLAVSEEQHRRRLRTSSPTSSADSSQLSVSPSWHKISSITPPPDISADPVRTQPELTDLPDSQASVTIAGPRVPAGRTSPEHLPVSRMVFRSLNQEDSGVGNEASISKSMDDVRVLPLTSEEEVDVMATDGEPAAFVSKSLREMLEGLRRRSQQLGMPADGTDFLKLPPPYPSLPPEPGGLSQISAPTDVTDTSAAYASLSEPETAILKLGYNHKGKNLIWPT